MHCRRKGDVSLLVIEDSGPELELMTYLLRAGGYCVLTARDGEEGLALANQEKIDLVICDVFLPGIDGYEVAKRLRAHPALHRIPLLAVTTLSQVGSKKQLREAGFDGHIGKPIEARTFVDNVESILILAGYGSQQNGYTPISGHRILLVDDLPMHADHLRANLEARGHQVYLASDIAKATEILAVKSVDLILLNLYLAEHDSFDFLSAVKSNQQHQDVPVVFLSSSEWSQENRQAILAMPHMAHLRRPINATRLLEEVGTWLPQAKASSV